MRPASMTVVVRLLAALAVLAAAVLFGRHLIDELTGLETWIAGLGVWGPVAFVLATVVLTSLFVPDTALAVVAGLAFGLWWGTLWVTLAGVLAAMLDFGLSRRLLRHRIAPLVAARPRLATLRRVAEREGLRFHLVLRLTPVSPTLLSYVLGTTHVDARTFALATVGHVPGWFAEVYVGYAAAHATKLIAGVSPHAARAHVLTYVGLVVSLVAVTWVARRALQAVRAAEARLPAA